MKRKIRGIICLVIIMLLTWSVNGCKKDEVKEKDDNLQQQVMTDNKDEEVEDEPEEVIPANQNLLTGLADLTEEAIGKRPVAVMVNNVRDALPQYGIAKADVIFEIPVEGDLTRLMALYGDYTQVPKVCAIRSCRKYFPAFSEGFDAVYVNWGMDTGIMDYVDSLNLTQYDGIYNEGGLFGRDSDRRNAGYSLEHTAYFDGTRLAEVMEKQGARTEIESDKTGTAFTFNGLNEQVKPPGTACTTINVDFGAALATLTYDSASNTYLKQINGMDQMDAVTGTQLAFTNVIVLETKITLDTNGVHKLIDWKGSADSVGYYISNGAMQKIHWSKADEESRLLLFDENGENLSINRGKTYIAVNYKGQATFK